MSDDEKKERREIGKAFLEVEQPKLRGRLRGALAEARFRLASRKERKRQEKAEIKRIEAQERASLQRSIIRKKVKMQLQKKFLPQEFRLAEARRKREMEALRRPKRQKGVAVSPFTTKTVGENILENLGGFGIRPAIQKPKPKKKRPKSIRIMFE